MIKWISLLFLFIIYAYPAFTQDMNRAKETVKKLSSRKMAGRGVWGNGQHKAAKYLVRAFKKAGLKPLNGHFLQNFTYSQNVFPNQPVLKTSVKKKAGIAFLPGPDCPPVRGPFKLKSKDSSGKKVLLNFKKVQQPSSSESSDETLQVQLTDKLTHSLSEVQGKIPQILLKKSGHVELDSVLDLWIDSKVVQTQGQNVIGMVPGWQHPDSFLVVCAHYDHLGRIGNNIFFPGANDNASGVSMLLEIARHYAKNPHRYSLVFIAFGAEEAGLIGSRFFVANPLMGLSRIRFVFNIDLFGFGEEGATVVNGTIHEKEFQKLVELNENGKFLKQIKPRGKAANSDHYAFSEKGIPAFFMYLMGGPGHYHDVWDVPSTLSFKGFEGSFKLISGFLDQL